jgi:hypothetical protein
MSLDAQGLTLDDGKQITWEELVSALKLTARNLQSGIISNNPTTPAPASNQYHQLIHAIRLVQDIQLALAPERDEIRPGERLSAIACTAAIQIDALRCGKGGKVAAIRYTANWLRDAVILRETTLELKTGPVKMEMSANFTDSTLLYQLLKSRGLDYKKIQDLTAPAHELAANLDRIADQSNDSQAKDPEFMAEHRRFCLDLSKMAQAREHDRHITIRHPYRRCHG